MCSSGRPAKDIRLRLRRTEPGVKRMADDSPAPPLTRRVPGAARGGPGSPGRPVLPEALLKRMQAAVDAARAGQREQSAGNQLRSTAGSGLAAPPAKNGKLAPSGPPPRRPLPVQLWPPVEVPPGQTPPAETPPPVLTPRPLRPPAQTPPAETPPPVLTPPALTPPPEQTRPPAQVRPPVEARPSVTGRAVPVQPRPRPTGPKARRRGPWVAGVAALAVILTAAVAFVLSSRSSARSPHSPQSHGPQSQTPQSQSPQSQSPQSQSPQSHRPEPPSKPASTAGLAAAWVVAQVGHDVVVACDEAMCDALTAHGYPGRHLGLIRSDSPAPLHAQVVVVTSVVQRQFGASLATKWAPTALASFGAGSAGISVRIMAPQGAARYEAALKADLRSLKAGGAGLLGSPHVSASDTARKQLLTGQVDSRLIVVLTALASVHPISILDFGPASAGASPGVPLRIARLAQDDAAAGLSRSAYLRFLLTELNLQPGVYKPEVAGPTHDAAGTLAFEIKFPAPSPLGIFGPLGP